jgi:glycosyltransferase involved in cell wall biosynthesis
MHEKTKFSIIIPVYNEHENIEELFSDIRQNYAHVPVIFVDDGSTDGSSGLLDEIERSDENTKVLRHRLNRGYGAALKTGVRACTTDVLVITDSDRTYPIESIRELLSSLDDHDMAVGSRTGANVKIPLLRKPAKWIIGQLANYLTGTRIPDLNSGLRAIRKNTLERFMHILPDGFSFTTSITLAMHTNGYGIRFIPIDYYSRKGRSKIRPVRDTLNFLQMIIRTVMYFNPLKVFLPLSLMLAMASLGVLLYSHFFMERILDATTVVLFIGAIQLLAIGMLADLIDKRSRD